MSGNNNMSVPSFSFHTIHRLLFRKAALYENEFDLSAHKGTPKITVKVILSRYLYGLLYYSWNIYFLIYCKNVKIIVNLIHACNVVV